MEARLRAPALPAAAALTPATSRPLRPLQLRSAVSSSPGSDQRKRLTHHKRWQPQTHTSPIASTTLLFHLPRSCSSRRPSASSLLSPNDRYSVIKSRLIVCGAVLTASDHMLFYLRRRLTCVSATVHRSLGGGGGARCALAGVFADRRERWRGQELFAQSRLAVCVYVRDFWQVVKGFIFPPQKLRRCRKQLHTRYFTALKV